MKDKVVVIFQADSTPLLTKMYDHSWMFTITANVDCLDVGTSIGKLSDSQSGRIDIGVGLTSNRSDSCLSAYSCIVCQTVKFHLIDDNPSFNSFYPVNSFIIKYYGDTQFIILWVIH